MPTHRDSDSSSEYSGSEVGHAENYSIPRQFSPLVWKVFCTDLLHALSLHFAERPAWQSLRILPNAAMSLMANLVWYGERGDEQVARDSCLRWWIGATAPITAGCIIVNRKLNAREEANFERAMVGRSDLAPEEMPEPVDHQIEYGDVRISIDSTNLSSDSQSQLIQSIKVGQTRLSVWLLPAIAVLAANDLLKSMETGEGEELGETAYLAGTLTATVHLWRITTPSERARKAEWLSASGMLIGRDEHASLLVSHFNKKIQQIFVPANSREWAHEAASRWMMPTHSGLSEVMAEIVSYMPPPTTAHRPSQITNPYRRRERSPERPRSRSPAHSLAKSRFTPQPRSHF